ncbi:MAG TPA: asparagine synthase (glutamine-hydrolyzing) [Candidatus Eisenbacteria bacterium]
MCGITGFLRLDASGGSSVGASVSDRDRPCLRAMTDACAHRGPDGEGFFDDGICALGHRRLAIIDLSTGDQPMSNSRGDCTIVFNGEIYNYVELKAELEGRGHKFRTQSDTEVILAAYDEWGDACQSRFNGMWAFALWDRRRRRLLISRDRLGEKPLHYAVHGGRLWFASTIRSLIAGGVPPEKCLDLVEVYLVLGYVPGPQTFYKHIRRLPAGNSLVVEGNSNPQVSAWWDLPAVPEAAMLTDRKHVDERFEELFDDSVRIRMRSDVPFGAFLSGGLDSASIVSSMARVSKEPVRTFTIGFDDKEFDERELARLVAERFGTRHREEVVQPETLAHALKLVARHTDQPFGDSSALPTEQVSRVARHHVTMVLTGDGGDEVLSGYTSYQGEKFAAQFQGLPSPLRMAAPALARGVGQLTGGGLRYKMNRVRNVLESSGQPYRERLISKMAWAPLPQVKALLAPAPARVSIEEYLDDFMGRCPWKDPFYRHMYFHLKLSLPDDMLLKVDRMSMAHGLETRVPFLDFRLVELMIGVHRDVKMNGYERKGVLRRSVGRRLPPAVLTAPKKGFAVPLRSWFQKESARPFLDDMQSGLSGLVDRKVLDQVVRENSSGAEDRGNFLWMLTILSGWLSVV